MYIEINKVEFPVIYKLLSHQYNVDTGRFFIKGQRLYAREKEKSLDQVRYNEFYFTGTQSYIAIETSKVWFKLYYELSKKNMSTDGYGVKDIEDYGSNRED